MLEFLRFSFAETDAFKDRTLNQEDVPKVACEILEVQTKSKRFGRVLGLPKVTVDSIHQQNSDLQERLICVLDEFVKQIEPPPTWRVIAEALRNPLIGFHRLADKEELSTHSPTKRYVPSYMPFTIDMKLFFQLPRSVYSQDRSLKTLLQSWNHHSPCPHLSIYQNMV